VDLMRVRNGVTVEEVARELSLTRTTISNHLKSLMSEGLVARSGLRRGPRRPSVLYVLTADADRIFPQLYEEFANEVLAEIAVSRAPQMERVLRGVGDRWIARDMVRVKGQRGRHRFDRALEVLARRGFMPSMKAKGSVVTLQHFNCPLRHLCSGFPAVRRMILRWIQALFGVRVRQTACICTGNPSCAYSLGSR
jgi:predicted ArsR family transcriptional regulator